MLEQLIVEAVGVGDVAQFPAEELSLHARGPRRTSGVRHRTRSCQEQEAPQQARHEVEKPSVGEVAPVHRSRDIGVDPDEVPRAEWVPDALVVEHPHLAEHRDEAVEAR